MKIRFLLKDIRDNLIRESGINGKLKNTKIKTHIMDHAIDRACKMYETCVTNYLAGNINKFRIRYLRDCNKRKIIDIENQYIKQNQICPTVLNDIKYTYDKRPYTLDTKKTVKMHYNKDLDKYRLLVPESAPITKTQSTKYVGIDPGIRTFQTCLTNNEVVKIGTSINDKLKKYLLKIDKINAKPTKGEIKSKKKIKRIYGKIEASIDELHWKTINFLTSNYGKILIGNFSTVDIANKKTSNIGAMTKRIGLMMRHYIFRQRLEYKCRIKGIELKVVNESYTSKTCSKCAHYNKDLGANKIYNCDNCHIKIDRDVNGCRGILIKGTLKEEIL